MLAGEADNRLPSEMAAQDGQQEELLLALEDVSAALHAGEEVLSEGQGQPPPVTCAVPSASEQTTENPANTQPYAGPISTWRLPSLYLDLLTQQGRG